MGSKYLSVGILLLGSIGLPGCGISHPRAMQGVAASASASGHAYRYTLESVLSEGSGVQFNVKFDHVVPHMTRAFTPSMFSYSRFSDHGQRFTVIWANANLWTGGQPPSSGWPRLAFNTEIPVDSPWVRWIRLRREGTAIRILCDLAKPAKTEWLGTMPTGFVLNFNT